MMLIEVAFVHPTIPWNTGNAGRTCVASNTTLNIVHPIGFDLSDTKLKRAGLDYWQHLHIRQHQSLEMFENYCQKEGFELFLFSRFAKQSYTDINYAQYDKCMLIFGSETDGLPVSFKEKYPQRLINIPTPGKVRSLNLSTSMAIALFEAIRQQLPKGSR